MRFELSIALKYLLPKRRQLSASIITLVSVCVVSLVVWLAVVFLSISEGLQKRWIESFTSFHAPLKIVPTEKYYQSYFYQIDAQSMDSGYGPKSIDEKRLAGNRDPYNPELDRQLPYDFPQPVRDEQGGLLNLVQQAWDGAEQLSSDAHHLELSSHSTSVCNLKIRIESGVEPSQNEAFISQICYVSPFEDKASLLSQKILYPDQKELTSLLAKSDSKEHFYSTHKVQKASLLADTVAISKEYYPSTGKCFGCSFYPTGSQQPVCLIPSDKYELKELIAKLNELGFEPKKVNVNFSKQESLSPYSNLYLTKGAQFDAMQWSSQDSLEPLSLHAKVQGISFTVFTSEEEVEIKQVEWPKAPHFYNISSSKLFTPNLPVGHSGEGHGILVASIFKKKGARIGDRGYLSFVAPSATSMQEQKVPVYIAGFFDTTTFPFASRYLFVHPDVFESTSVNLNHMDDLFADGIQISYDEINKTALLKERLQEILVQKGISDYWRVISFDELDFVRPILTQFQTEKTLFTLIMTIILTVASTNIISMLILLVNDKTREIGILLSLGASRWSIANIFGLCGLITGLISSFVGTALAVLTIRNIGSLTFFLSKLQGREFFQADFYGGELPAYVSIRVLIMTLLATVILSILAAIIPALKACSMNPTQILRREQA